MSTRSMSEAIASIIRRPIRTKVKRLFKPFYTKSPVQSIDNMVPSVSAAPTALSMVEIISKLPNLFPRTVSDSVRDYQHIRSRNDDVFQQELLMTLPFYPVSDSSKQAEIIKTKVDAEGNYINEFCIKPAARNLPASKMKHLVFIHGYGAGLGFFIKNLENIPLLNNEWCIHAIDLPGYGFSSRTRFPFQYPRDTLNDAQEWFHERMHTWFDKRGLLKTPQNNLIMAHSLGAYLMSNYVAKYPNHFKKLIMCSPAGICKSTSMAKLGNASPPWWYSKLWERNISPFSLVRNSLHLGSKLTSGWSYRRFRKILQEGTSLSRKQFEALHRYSYAIFNRSGCGEYLLSFALRCGGDPRVSLEDSIFQNVSNGIYKSNCEWLWMYGDHDWMDVQGGNRVSAQLNKYSAKERSKVCVVPNSGHHLYLDNYKYFNEVMINEMGNM